MVENSIQERSSLIYEAYASIDDDEAGYREPVSSASEFA